LHKIVPQATQVHVMYHPKDQVALTALKPLPAMASSLGVELVLDEVRSLEEALAVIATLSKDAAIFLVPTPGLGPLSALIEVALKRGIAVGTTELSHLPAGALVGYAGSFPAMGEQAARLAGQILKGTKPSDLPVETAESFLRINLKTATAMGLDIPDEFLRQADTVIR
jgi:putative ABC transport system substrate-binding protein